MMAERFDGEEKILFRGKARMMWYQVTSPQREYKLLFCLMILRGLDDTPGRQGLIDKL